MNNWNEYAEQEFAKYSPLYHEWWQKMKIDQDMQVLLKLMRSDQPPPTFFSMVNYLLFLEPDHELSLFYPLLTDHPGPASESYPVFRSFCLAHLNKLKEMLPTIRLQTNEVIRCANLLPAFELVYKRGGQKPLHMVEIGASAGLNLNWHRYRYKYLSPMLSMGDLRSPVRIACHLRGNRVPPFRFTLPQVRSIVGIEIAPINLAVREDVLWLRACIWPELLERYEMLSHALSVAQVYPPQILAGDAKDLLPRILSDVPYGVTLCVYHSYALTQGPPDIYEQIINVLVEHSQHHDVYRVELETVSGEGPRLALSTYKNRELDGFEVLARCAVHGGEMEWLA